MNARNPSTHGKLSVKSDVMGGALCIAGTRLPVDMLLDWISAGIGDAEMLREFASLVPADLDAVRMYRDRGWCEQIRMVEPDAAPPKAIDTWVVVSGFLGLSWLRQRAVAKRADLHEPEDDRPGLADEDWHLAVFRRAQARSLVERLWGEVQREQEDQKNAR